MAVIKRSDVMVNKFNYSYHPMIRFIAAFMFLWFSVQAVADTGKPATPDEIAEGKRLYESYCLTCHGQAGVGEAPIPKYIRAPGYITAMPLNETSHAWHHSDEQLVETILNGLQRTNRMPAWKGVLDEQEARAVVGYIKSLWSPRILACQGPRHMSCM
ncbi:MAG: cytochrome c [Sedimenticola sp.]|nr:cytochrome c [Sedimenticola sp.]